MKQTWRQILPALRHDWTPLVAYELVVSLFAATVVSPSALTVAYFLIGLQGDSAAVGNWDLAELLLTPLGALAFVFAASLAVGWVFVEYSGLIVLADAALRGGTLSTRQVMTRMLDATGRLFGLAVLQTSLAIALALPFLGLAAVTYRLLLENADINFYFTERPPRFWIALATGIALVVGYVVCVVWLFLRWALAVPACVLDGQNWLAALRLSSHRMRGRGWRVLILFVGWQLLKTIALIAVTAGLARINRSLLMLLDDSLSLLVWSALVLLLLDIGGLRLLGAIFAIGLAVLLASEYEQAQRSDGEPGGGPAAPRLTLAPERKAWGARAAIVAVALFIPAASIFSALMLDRQFVEHRTTRVTGHRAGSKAAPENSLAALRMSIAAGADDVEIDVQQTADGHVVLLHDRDLRRVTGDPGQLHDLKLADLADLRLRDERGPSDEKIPTLAEFLAACDDRIRLNIELKDPGRSPGLALAVLDVLRDAGFTRRAGVSCFEMPPLQEIKNAEPQLPIGIILSATGGDVTRLPVDFLSLNQRLVRASLVRRAHERGKEVHAWTVNERESALRLLDLGCDNLITSDPKLMREVVDWYAGLGDVQRMLLRLGRWLRE